MKKHLLFICHQGCCLTSMDCLKKQAKRYPCSFTDPGPGHVCPSLRWWPHTRAPGAALQLPRCFSSRGHVLDSGARPQAVRTAGREEEDATAGFAPVTWALFPRLEKTKVRFCHRMRLAYVIWTIRGGLWILTTTLQVAGCSGAKSSSACGVSK